jgi:hypothetical protein
VSPEEFEAQIKASLQVVVTQTSPPSSPLSSPLGGSASLVLLSPLGSMNLDPALAPEYYRAAFRVWIEDLRPKVHSVCGCSGGCCGGTKDPNEPPKPDACVLLGRIIVPVIQSSGNWVVDDTGTVEIDESRRPMLLHLRMLQELLVNAPAVVAAPSAPAGPVVVAAGLVGVDASATPVFGGLTVVFQAQNTLRLSFTGYDVTRRYIVKALGNTGIANPTISYNSAVNNGILLRVMNGAANVADNTLRAAQFMIEISQIG